MKKDDRRKRMYLTERVLTMALAVALPFFIVGCRNNQPETEAFVDSSTERAEAAAEAPVRAEEPAEADRPKSANINETKRRFGDRLELVTRTPKRALGDQPITVEATIRNVSQQSIENVALTQELPKAFSVTKTVIDGKPSAPAQSLSAGRARYDIGELQAGESRTVELTGRAAEEAKQLDLLFGVEYPMTVRQQIPVERAELEVQVAVLTGQEREGFYYPCDDLRLRYEIVNTGDVDVRNLVVREDLPEALRVKGGEQAIQFKTANLAAGKTLRKEIAIAVDKPVEFRPRTVLESEFGRKEEEGQLIRFSRPRLHVAIKGPSEHRLGDPLRYAIAVRNQSGVPALDTKVTMPIPDGVTINEMTGQDVKRDGDTFALGRIEPNATKTFRLDLKTKSAEALSLEAKADAYCLAEPVSDKIETKLQGVPAVHLELTDAQDPIRVGESSIYELTLRNQGTQPLSPIRLQMTAPMQFKFIEADGDTEVRFEERALHFDDLPTLAAGQELSWRLKFEAVRTGQAFFEARLQTPALDQIVIEQEPTTVY